MRASTTAQCHVHAGVDMTLGRGESLHRAGLAILPCLQISPYVRCHTVPSDYEAEKHTRSYLEHSSPHLTNDVYTNVDPVLRQAVDLLPVSDWL